MKTPLYRNSTVSSFTAYDVWSKEEEVDNYNDDGGFLQLTKKRKIKEPPTLKLKPTQIIPAVHKPHSGASYNPTFEDHQLLLKIAHEEEVDKLLKKERIAKELPQLRLSSKIEDMSDDDGKNNNNLSEKEEDDDDDDDKNVFTSNKNQYKKTKTERNKEKKKSILLKEQEEKIAKKNQRKQLEKLSEIIETVEQNNINAKKNLIKKELARKELSKLPKKKIGRHKVQKLPIEIQLSDELAGSLRKLKPEGNLFQDRMVSLQERNIIEPRVKISKRRKYKLKEFEKASYKT